MRILLLGKNGQVGWELQRSLALLGEVIALDFDSPGPLKADFSVPESLAATVRAVAPMIIVNAAAHTAVDRCESEPERARAINAEAPAMLARAAREHGATLVHYSTDYVFDGSGSVPWRERDATGPLSVYGATKLAGEEAIRDSGCVHLVLRTSWVHSARGGNFARTMLRLGGERDALSVVADQVGAPTSAELLADTTATMLRKLQQEPGLAGTYHVAAAGECSWYDYALHVFAYARAHGRALKVTPESVSPIASSAYPTPAKRPANSRLDTTKARAAFDLVFPPWQAGVERSVAEMLDQK